MDRAYILRRKFFRERHYWWYSVLRLVFSVLGALNRNLPRDPQRSLIMFALSVALLDTIIYKIPYEYSRLRKILAILSLLVYAWSRRSACETDYIVLNYIEGAAPSQSDPKFVGHNPMLFFEYINTFLRMNHTQSSLNELVLLLDSIMEPYPKVREGSDLIDYRMVQFYEGVIRVSAFALAYSVLEMRRVCAYRLWDKCQILLILQQKINKKQKYIYDLTDFYGTRKISELLKQQSSVSSAEEYHIPPVGAERVNIDNRDGDEEAYGAARDESTHEPRDHALPPEHIPANSDTATFNSMVLQSMMNSSASSLELRIVKSALKLGIIKDTSVEDDYAPNLQMSPAMNRGVGKALRWESSAIVGIKILRYSAVGPTDITTRHPSITIPDQSMYSTIDCLAEKYNITFVRRFGDSWIGFVGFFGEARDPNDACYRAIQMCCEVQHVAMLNSKRVCCVLDMGEVLGGFLRSPSFDIFGPQIRRLLINLMTLSRDGIFCSASMCNAQSPDTSGVNEKPHIPFDIQVMHSEVSTEEVLFKVINALECSRLTEEEIENFNARLVINATHNKLADHIQHLRNDLKAAKSDRNSDNCIYSQAEDKRGVYDEVDPFLVKPSNELINLSLADPIMAEYSDADWEAMHLELLKHVQNIVWENIEEKSTLYRIREYLNLRNPVDHYAYDGVAKDISQTYLWSKTTSEQAFYYDRLSPEEEIVYPDFDARKLYSRQRWSVLSLASIMAFISWCKGCADSLYRLIQSNLHRSSMKIRMVYKGPSLDIKDVETDMLESLAHSKNGNRALGKRDEESKDARERSSHKKVGEQEDANDKDKQRSKFNPRPILAAAPTRSKRKWGTKISYTKYFRDAKYPFLNSVYLLVFRILLFVPAILLMSFAANENRLLSSDMQNSIDRSEWGSRSLAIGCIAGSIFAELMIERKHSNLAATVIFVCHALMTLKTIDGSLPTPLEAQLTDLGNGLIVDADIIYGLLLYSFYGLFFLRLSLYPLITMVINFVACLLLEVVQESFSFFTHESFWPATTDGSFRIFYLLIMWFLLTVPVERDTLYSFLIEHQLMPFSLEVYEEDKKRQERYTRHFLWDVDEGDALRGHHDLIFPCISGPHLYKDVVVVALNVKAADVLQYHINSRAFAKFMDQMMSAVDSCIKGCGLVKVNEFSGMITCVCFKDSPQAEDPSHTNFLTRPFTLIRSITRKMKTLVLEHSYSFRWSMCVDVGTVALGLLGGERGCLDVASATRDLTCICATIDTNGLVFVTPTFQERFLEENDSFPNNIKSELVELNVRDDVVPLYKIEAVDWSHTLSDYEYHGFLDSGGFGSVHIAREKLTSALHAIKVLEISTKSDYEVRRMMAEFQVIKEIAHPNIIYYKQYILANDRIYFVMKCIEGGNLKQVVEKYSPPLHHLIVWYAELVLALECIHSKSILHRDVKPANCLIGIDGHLRLADFGLSKVLPNSNMEKSIEGDSLSRKVTESSNDADFGIISDNCEQKDYLSGDDKGENLELFEISQQSRLAHVLTNVGPPVYSIMVVTTDQMTYGHSISDDLRFLNYLCTNVHNNLEKAARNLRVEGLFDMVLIVVPQDTANSILQEQTTTNEVDMDDSNDFVANMVIISSNVPNLPVVMVTSTEEAAGRSRLERYYSALAKRSGHANPVKVVNAPLQTPNNVDLIAKIARLGRSSVSHAGKLAVSSRVTTQHPDLTNYDALSESYTGISMSVEPTAASMGETFRNFMQAREKKENKKRRVRPAGTINYVAPELVVHTNYGRMVDWWACGVTFYECTTGTKLFGAGTRRSTESVLNEILHRDIDFTPLTKVSEQQRKDINPQEIYKTCYNLISRRDNVSRGDSMEYISRIEDLVRGLLCRKETDRLGYESMNEIREHPFFSSINWTTLSYSQTAWRPEVHEKFKPKSNVRKKVKVVRGDVLVSMDPLELFYGKNHKQINRKKMSSRELKKGSARTQVNRRLYEEKQKFAHVSDLRQEWLRSERSMSSSRHYFETERNMTLPQIDEDINASDNSRSNNTQSDTDGLSRTPKESKSGTLTDTMDFSESVSISAQSEHSLPLPKQD